MAATRVPRRVETRPVTRTTDLVLSEIVPPHTHPAPSWLRLLLVAYGICFLLAYGGILALFVQGQHRDSLEQHRQAQATYEQCIERRATSQVTHDQLAETLTSLRPDTDPAIADVLRTFIASTARTVSIACPKP